MSYDFREIHNSLLKLQLLLYKVIILFTFLYLLFTFLHLSQETKISCQIKTQELLVKLR